MFWPPALESSGEDMAKVEGKRIADSIAQHQYRKSAFRGWNLRSIDVRSFGAGRSSAVIDIAFLVQPLKGWGARS